MAADSRGQGWSRDLIAGTTNAISNIPDAMANAILAGVSPINGLYALVAGTPVAALTTGSPVMTVAVTGSMALMVGDALKAVPTEEALAALVVLCLLVGALQIALGLVKAGGMLRFVSYAVLRGFMTGVAVNIVLSQFGDLTGASSAVSGRVFKAVDVTFHPQRWELSSLVVAAVTVIVLLLAERTRLRDLSFVLALLVATAISWIPVFTVERVSDIAQIPGGLPSFTLPTATFALQLLLPAAAIALVGLIQGAAVSRTVPNDDGTYPSVNRDFLGQGLSNVTSGLFGGVPVGGSVGSTALLVQLGAKRRIANFIVGPLILMVLLLLAPAVEAVPLSCLAAILVVIGVRAVDVPAIQTVLHTSVPSATIMVITFAGTLFMPIQYAVLMGVGLSIVQYVYSSSLDIRLVELSRGPDGGVYEQKCPEVLQSRTAMLIDIYGSVFYAGADTIERLLPDPAGAGCPVVILRLRGRDNVGATFIDLLRRYHARLDDTGGKLMLAGVSPSLMQQLERTGLVDQLGLGNIYAAGREVTATALRALGDAEEWLAERSEAECGPPHAEERDPAHG